MEARKNTIRPLATAHVVGTLVAVAWCAMPHGIPHVVNLELPATSSLYFVVSIVLILWLSKYQWAVGSPWRTAISAFLCPHLALFISWDMIYIFSSLKRNNVLHDILLAQLIYLFWPYIVFHGYAASIASATVAFLLARRQRPAS